METIKLGRTNLEVSRICLGTWQFGGDWGEIDRGQAKAAVRRALELGVDFFDTAQAYGFGASEALLAEALEGVPREEVVIATKGGLRREGDELVRDAGREWLRSGLEQSLRHLRTDYVDIFQIHWPDPSTPFAETAEVLEELIREGKARCVGVSNFDAVQLAEFERRRKLDTLQPPYHMFRREIESDVLPYCGEHDIGVLAYGPLAHGLLSGRLSSDTEIAPDDWRSSSPLFTGDAFQRNLLVVAELKALAAELELSVAQLAISWTLAHPAVHVAIVGVRNPLHIEQSAPAADVHLDDSSMRRIERILAGAATVGGPSPENDS
jgi:aryl-alcohol dehydrogenase-like predicted oxidoreductase